MTAFELHMQERINFLESRARGLRNDGDRLSECALKMAQEAEKLADEYAEYINGKKE